MKYLCDPHILPTNTCPPDLLELEKRTAAALAFAPEIQLDAADGVFAPVTSWPYLNGQWSQLEHMAEAGTKLPHAGSIVYEAHLMVQEPAAIGTLFARVGCMRILPHVETLKGKDDTAKMFSEWKAAGAKEVGVSMLLDTPLTALEPYAEMCDVVQLMSIAKVGAQGQPFDESIYSRIEELRAMYPDMMVAVDGGVAESNVEALTRAGANRLCVGSAISKAGDPAAAYAAIHARAMRGCAPVTIEMNV
jgi:pentose-5-phosphate-3-epimerase